MPQRFKIMKPMTYRLLLAVFAIALCADLHSAEKREFPQVSLIGPGASTTPANRDEFILLVVEGPHLTYESNMVPTTGVVDYVNNLLKVKKVSYIGVYTREGVKYGDLVRAIDLLRQTDAKSIGVSMKELPAGKEP